MKALTVRVREGSQATLPLSDAPLQLAAETVCNLQNEAVAAAMKSPVPGSFSVKLGTRTWKQVRSARNVQVREGTVDSGSGLGSHSLPTHRQFKLH